MKPDTIDVPGDGRSRSSWILRGLGLAVATAAFTSFVWALIIVASAR